MTVKGRKPRKLGIEGTSQYLPGFWRKPKAQCLLRAGKLCAALGVPRKERNYFLVGEAAGGQKGSKQGLACLLKTKTYIQQ